MKEENQQQQVTVKGLTTFSHMDGCRRCVSVCVCVWSKWKPKVYCRFHSPHFDFSFIRMPSYSLISHPHCIYTRTVVIVLKYEAHHHFSLNRKTAHIVCGSECVCASVVKRKDYITERVHISRSKY